MGISVEGQKCPVCNAYIFDNDDLVFCPECGAPHHRDCYEVLGHCAYKDKHGTPEGYNPNAGKTKVMPDEEPVAENKRSCSFCGEKLDETQRVCHKCGRPQYANEQTPFGAGVRFDPMGGVLPDEKIGDVTANEVKSFVVVNTPRYLPRFKAMNTKGRGSWNWAAFLVPHVWFFYRKMYLPGILFTLLMITTSLFLLPLSAIVSTFPQEATRSSALLVQYLTQNFTMENALPIGLAIFSLVAELCLRLVAGFMGDKIYRNTVINGVKKVKEEHEELEVPLEEALSHKGGVNIFLGVTMLFFFDFILEWVGSLYMLL